MKTVSITDFRIKSNLLAKVIVSYTGQVDAEFIHESLTRQLGYAATPVRASFKRIRDGVAVGFVRANREVRAASKAEVSAGYRVMSSNILMDNEDKTLWEVKDGVAGKYLARHGQEDLTALVTAAVQRRSDIPGLRHITIAKAAQSEMVAFVDDEGDMDYGFALATSEDQVKVLSFNRRIAINAGYDQVVSISPVSVPKSVSAPVLSSLTAEEKKVSIDYYRRLYGYAPDYLREVIDQINQGTEA